MPDQNNLEFPDVMVDIETGGLDGARNPILSVSAVKFNIKAQTVSPDFFNCNILPDSIINRYWDEGTRSWWLKDKRAVLETMLINARPAKDVFVALAQWAGEKANLWAMPTHFDYNWLQQAYKDLGFQIPFHYRSARDVNSFIDGLFYPHQTPTADLWGSIQRTGDLHNALDDCLHQLRYVFQAIEVARLMPREILSETIARIKND